MEQTSDDKSGYQDQAEYAAPAAVARPGGRAVGGD